MIMREAEPCEVAFFSFLFFFRIAKLSLVPLEMEDDSTLFEKL